MVGWLEGPVNSVIGDLEKEGTGPVLLDEVYGATGYLICQVCRSLDCCRVLEEIRCSIATPMCVVIQSPAEEAKKLVEAMCVGTKLRFDPEVPFADKTG